MSRYISAWREAAETLAGLNLLGAKQGEPAEVGLAWRKAAGTRLA
jgi:hypothetical protein